LLVRRLSQDEDFKNGKESELRGRHIHICSENNFPTAAGLASSAAGYSCLGILADNLFFLFISQGCYLMNIINIITIIMIILIMIIILIIMIIRITMIIMIIVIIIVDNLISSLALLLFIFVRLYILLLISFVFILRAISVSVLLLSKCYLLQ